MYVPSAIVVVDLFHVDQKRSQQKESSGQKKHRFPRKSAQYLEQLLNKTKSNSCHIFLPQSFIYIF